MGKATSQIDRLAGLVAAIENETFNVRCLFEHPIDYQTLWDRGNLLRGVICRFLSAPIRG